MKEQLQILIEKLIEKETKGLEEEEITTISDTEIIRMLPELIKACQEKK